MHRLAQAVLEIGRSRAAAGKPSDCWPMIVLRAPERDRRQENSAFAPGSCADVGTNGATSAARWMKSYRPCENGVVQEHIRLG